MANIITGYIHRGFNSTQKRIQYSIKQKLTNSRNRQLELLESEVSILMKDNHGKEYST